MKSTEMRVPMSDLLRVRPLRTATLSEPIVRIFSLIYADTKLIPGI